MIDTHQASDKKSAREPAPFASPFGQDDNEPSTPTIPNQSYESPQKA